MSLIFATYFAQKVPPNLPKSAKCCFFVYFAQIPHILAPYFAKKCRLKLPPNLPQKFRLISQTLV